MGLVHRILAKRLAPEARERFLELERKLSEAKPLAESYSMDDELAVTHRDLGLGEVAGIERVAAVDIRKNLNHLIVAGILRFNYGVGHGRPSDNNRKVKVVIEGDLPTEPSVLLMNHTDRYSYWPLQLEMLRRQGDLSTVWVKTEKRGAFTNWFYDKMGMVAVPRPKAQLMHAFRRLYGDIPGDEKESRRIVELLDDVRRRFANGGKVPLRELRGETGRVAGFATETCPRLAPYFSESVRLFELVTAQASEHGLHIIAYPQGTRSKRVTPGKPSAIQYALSRGVPIVPIGVNGGDEIYPGGMPWAKRGTVVYRVGVPLTAPDFESRLDLKSMTLGAQLTENQQGFLERSTSTVMRAIDNLVDDQYKAVGSL